MQTRQKEKGCHKQRSESESCSVVSNSLGENSPGKNTGMGSLPFIQGIFRTQELNQGCLHCRQTLYQLGYQGIPNRSKFFVTCSISLTSLVVQ